MMQLAMSGVSFKAESREELCGVTAIDEIELGRLSLLFHPPADELMATARHDQRTFYSRLLKRGRACKASPFLGKRHKKNIAATIAQLKQEIILKSTRYAVVPVGLELRNGYGDSVIRIGNNRNVVLCRTAETVVSHVWGSTSTNRNANVKAGRGEREMVQVNTKDH